MARRKRELDPLPRASRLTAMLCKAIADGAEFIVVSYHSPDGSITSLGETANLTRVKHVVKDAAEAVEAGLLKRRRI